ncbi:unnamed protein product [Linum tenue]|uniref:PWWP domain-containing protein n=1 Tax=Linum tenue TaxID=586396 RepID=A0AAV0QSF2_9ROSI|nr:unnamed protein product [Linum tenue]
MEDAKTPDKTLVAENPDGKTIKAGNFVAMGLLGQATGSCPEKCGAVESQSEALPEGHGKKIIAGNGVCEGEKCASGDLTSVIVSQVVNGGHALEVDKVSSLRDCADGEFRREEHSSGRVLAKGNYTLAIDGVSTGRNVNDSGDDISLYVELPGPLHQTGYSEDMDCVGLTKDGARKECEKEPIKRFCVGDVVWVRMKNQSWRPGKICGDSNAMICSKEGYRINCHVVQYFGASHFTWCPPYNLRHFHDNFDQLVGGNQGRNFTGAVEKAMDEFMRCLKSEINCSCMVKQGGSSDKEGKYLQEFRFGKSVTKFEPMEFLSRIKQLAVAVSKPPMLEFAVAKIHVEAFSCFRGHLQLHIDELWEQSPKKRNGGKNGSMTTKINSNALVGDKNSTPVEGTGACHKETLGQNDLESRSRKRKRKQFFEINFRREDLDLGEDLLTTPSAKETGNLGSPSKTNNQSFDLRERKRSKYLSYPYVSLEHKNNRPDEKEKSSGLEMKVLGGGEDVVGLSGASSISSDKRFRNRWFKNFISDTSISSKPEFLGASVSDLLSELSRASVDCSYQSKSKTFALVEWFFSRFRISAFHDESIYERHCKNTIWGNAAEIQTPPGKVAEEISQTLPPMQKVWKNTNKSGNSVISNVENATNGTAANNNCGIGILPSSDKGPVYNNGREEQGTSVASQKIDQIANIPDLNSCVGGVPNLLSLSPQAVTKIHEKATLQVVNGNISEPVTLSECLHGKGPFSTNHLPVEGNVTCSTFSISDTDGKIISFGPSTRDPPLISCGTVKTEGKPVAEKRKRKEIPVSEQVISGATGIPDLNWGLAETGTFTNLGAKRGRGRGRGGNPGRPTKTYAPSAQLVKYSRKWFNGEPPKEPESQPLQSPGAPPHVFFTKAADGDKSFRSSEKGNNTFGRTPVSCQLLPVAASPTSPSKGELKTSEMPAAPKAVVAPPIDAIRQNLEMMTSMLQKSGDGLSPEMRRKLESEINSLMKKVSSMSKSSS